MKKFNYIFLAATIFIFIACKKSFDDMNLNENKPTSVPPGLLFNGILNDMYDRPYSMYERWSQYYCCNYDYYGNQRYDFGSGLNCYSTLKNVLKMEEEALKIGALAVNPYAALAKFFKAYFFTRMSLQMGDIPMTEALKASDNLTPVYDPQKKIFKQALAWLDTANTELGQLIAANSNTLSGDIYFDNNLTKWRKAVNTFKIRLLIHLSKKTADAELQVAQQFAAILADPVKYPIMTGMADNLQYKYIYPTNNYPMSPDNFGFDALRYNTNATYISLLSQANDPRVYVVAEPAPAIVNAGTSPTSFSAFVGAPAGEDLGQMYIKVNNGQYSLINRRHFYQTYTAEPSIQIGFPELMFNIAEGLNRGWAATGALGNAEAYYKAGIKASWAFYGVPETGPFNVYFLQSGSPGTTAVYNTYTVNVDFDLWYDQATVKYPGNTTDGLTLILKQKYVAQFRHSGLESYFNYRRTGVPAFHIGPGTGNSSRIALRFKYPGSEATANKANYEAALQAQYGGNDDINGVMWINQ